MVPGHEYELNKIWRQRRWVSGTVQGGDGWQSWWGLEEMKVDSSKETSWKVTANTREASKTWRIPWAKPAEEVRREDARREKWTLRSPPRNPCRWALAHRQVIDKHEVRKENRTPGAFHHDGHAVYLMAEACKLCLDLEGKRKGWRMRK